LKRDLPAVHLQPARSFDEDVEGNGDGRVAASIDSAPFPSVCESPVGMKQNCREPESLTVRSTSESTSSPAGPSAAGTLGFPIKSLGNPAKDTYLRAAYREACKY